MFLRSLGKSFLFEPLEEIYGEDFVFSAPPKGSFPLLNLERCRLALLDDWRFNEDVISYNLQLLWFEGKPIVIARPQNQFSGHLKYCKDDPVFITTLLSDITNLKGKKIQGGDVEMMMRRLLVFEFSHKLESPCKVPVCGHCFARLLLDRPLAQEFLPAGREGHLASSDGLAEPRLKVGRTAKPEKDISQFSVEEVGVFLGEIGLGRLAYAFELNAVDGPFLATLEHKELVNELGCTALQAKKIRSYLR